jgi:hypothetical protein
MEWEAYGGVQLLQPLQLLWAIILGLLPYAQHLVTYFSKYAHPLFDSTISSRKPFANRQSTQWSCGCSILPLLDSLRRLFLIPYPIRSEL